MYFSQLIAYTYTFLKNPGLPNKSMSVATIENKDITTDVKICNQCNIIVTPGKGINHCDDCGVCIIGN